MDNDLFEQMGLGALPDSEKERLSEAYGKEVMNRIADRLEVLLTPEQMEQLDKVSARDPMAALQEAAKFVPEVPVIIREEMLSMRQELIETHQDMIAKLDQARAESEKLDQ